MSDRREDRGREDRGRDDRGRDDRGRGDLACKVYIGDLPRDATEKDIERTFGYYGATKSIWISQNPPGFAFVEFEDARDAGDAVRKLDGTDLCGQRVRVELSKGRSRRGGGGGWRGGGGGYGDRGGRGGGRGFNPDDRCYECNGSGHYAYDCPQSSGSRRGGGGGYRGGGGGGGGGYRRASNRSRSRSPRRKSYSRSRSRSPGGGR